MPDDDDPDAEVARLESLSDEALLAEAAAEGVDVPAEAARVREVLRAAIAPSPARDQLVLIDASEAKATLQAAIARERALPVLLVDRPKAAEPEEPIDVILPVATARPADRAFRPARVECVPPPEPWVCPPVRHADCPACPAKAGERCESFDRWDECHAARLTALSQMRCAEMEGVVYGTPVRFRREPNES